MEFTDIIGHEKEKKILLDYVGSGRLPHALLFSGPPGIGKKTVALSLAEYLLCNNKKGGDGCASCRKVEKRIHPDLFILGGGDESLGIEAVRQISYETQKSPHMAERRVVVVDDAHLLTIEAANALLKTIEEPKEFNLFILITSKEEEIPFTLKSRCVKVPFFPIGVGYIKHYLMEKKGLDEKKAEIVSNISFGSLSAALFWMENENFLLRKHLAECILGTKKSSIEITFLSERISGEGCEIFLYFLLTLFRDVFICNMAKGENRVYNKDLLDLLRGRDIDGKRLKEKIETIIETLKMLKYNINRWSFVENLLILLAEEL